MRTFWFVSVRESCAAQRRQTQCSVTGSPIPMRACILSATHAVREDSHSHRGRPPVGTNTYVFVAKLVGQHEPLISVMVPSSSSSSGLWWLWFHHCNFERKTQFTMSRCFLLVLHFTKWMSRLSTHIFHHFSANMVFIHVSPSKNKFHFSIQKKGTFRCCTSKYGNRIFVLEKTT